MTGGAAPSPPPPRGAFATERNVRDYAAGFDCMTISIDIYILADALARITFAWVAMLSVCRMIETHALARAGPGRARRLLASLKA